MLVKINEFNCQFSQSSLIFGYLIGKLQNFRSDWVLLDLIVGNYVDVGSKTVSLQQSLRCLLILHNDVGQFESCSDLKSLFVVPIFHGESHEELPSDETSVETWIRIVKVKRQFEIFLDDPFPFSF